MFTPAFFQWNLYKGSAKQTRALAVLLRWLCESVWIKNPELAAAANSFLKLGKCNECLRRITQLKNYDDLEKHQREHHIAFQAAFPDSLRPKHHHRLHLPKQYKDMPAIATCWGTEAKHKDYKGVFSTLVQHFLQEKTAEVNSASSYCQDY